MSQSLILISNYVAIIEIWVKSCNLILNKKDHLTTVTEMSSKMSPSTLAVFCHLTTVTEMSSKMLPLTLAVFRCRHRSN